MVNNEVMLTQLDLETPTFGKCVEGNNGGFSKV